MRIHDIKLFIALSVLGAITAFLYIFPVPWVDQEVAINISFLIFPFFAAVSGFKAMKAYGSKNEHGKSFLFISLGIGSFFVGEAIYAVYELVLNIDPYPSVADLFYIAAYPLILIGIIREIIANNSSFSVVRSFIISAFSICLSMFVFYIMIFPNLKEEQPLLDTIISVSYGIADLLLIVSVSHILFMIIDFRGGRLFQAWVYILIATLGMLLGDIFFAQHYELYEKNVFPYRLIDFFWIISYMFYASGFNEMRLIVRDVQYKIKQLL